MKDYAFLTTGSGQIICGLGPFSARADPPASGVAFYVNDFWLGDPLPWKLPQSWFKAADLSALRESRNEGDEFRVEWSPPDKAQFASVYGRIKEEIRCGTFQKTVPVLSERGHLRSGQWEALLQQVETLAYPFFGYGFRFGGKGIVGGSPELLMTVRERSLETMALAGTVECSAIERFETDPKEISEHELVAEYLCGQLATKGAVQREPRSALRLGPIAHLLSVIRVDLWERPGLNELIRFVHPTPALGTLPRDEAAAAKLQAYREELGTPPWFGAPFGVWAEGVFRAVVAIRNLVWDGSEVCLAAGCGVIEASRLENEWHELGLKRSAVKQMLGL